MQKAEASEMSDEARSQEHPAEIEAVVKQLTAIDAVMKLYLLRSESDQTELQGYLETLSHLSSGARGDNRYGGSLTLEPTCRNPCQ